MRDLESELPPPQPLPISFTIEIDIMSGSHSEFKASLLYIVKLSVKNKSQSKTTNKPRRSWLYLCFLAVLGIEPRALLVLVKCFPLRHTLALRCFELLNFGIICYTTKSEQYKCKQWIHKLFFIAQTVPK